MKKISLKTVLLATCALLVLSASFTMALPNNVSNSKHNFSSGGTGIKSTQYIGEFNEVCKYCHTPHNAGSSQLLWNKANRTGATYRMYTSSVTLTRATATGTFTADSPSLLCLGCHDGKSALNVMHNVSGRPSAAGDGYAAGAQYIEASGSTLPRTIASVPIMDFDLGTQIGQASMNLGEVAGNAQQGDNLTNDHPVGFSYSAVLTERSAGLYDINQVKTNSSNKIKFFGATNRLECSSCHNPHADGADAATIPFLVMNNTGSALCLSCHNK